MFNRHQVEITVMQFRGHSLPVHQSMSVPWEFFSSSHFISQFPPTRFHHITAIGMCHFLPVHHLEWHFARADGQNITTLVPDYGKRNHKRPHPVDLIKGVVQSSEKVPEFDKHLKKAGGHIGRNVVEITIKMKTIVQKPLMIKIITLRQRNLENKHLKKAEGHIGRNVVELTIKMKTIVGKPLMIKKKAKAHLFAYS